MAPLLLLAAALARAEPPRPPAAAPTQDPQPAATGKNLEACEDEGTACPMYRPSKSNLSLAKAGRKASVHFDFFGANDCRASSKRELGNVDMIVLHQGGYSAKQNMHTWACRPAAAHYTIDRDGTIYQHVGEEWATPHSGPGTVDTNANSIGIELAIPEPTDGGGNCNQVRFSKKTPENVRKVLARCSPTAEQYLSLQSLVEDIVGRTGAMRDEEHIVGHCETSRGSHGDPRAFDWFELGLSNEKKQAAAGSVCSWYYPFPAAD